MMSHSWASCKSFLLLLFNILPSCCSELFDVVSNIIMILYFYSQSWSMDFKLAITRVKLMKMINSSMYPVQVQGS